MTTQKNTHFNLAEIKLLKLQLKEKLTTKKTVL